MTRWWCAYCASHMFSAAHPPVIRWEGEPERGWWHPAGPGEIEALYDKWQEALAQDPNARLYLGSRVNPELIGTTMVDGTSVCLSHLYDAIESWRRYPRPSYVPQGVRHAAD